MIMMGVFLTSSFYRAFKSAFSSNVFNQWTKMLRKCRLELEKGSYDKFIGFEKKRDEAEKLNEATRTSGFSMIYFCHGVIDFIARKVRKAVEQRRHNFYPLLTLVYAIFITIIIYAFEYYALWKINPNSFEVAHLNNNTSFMSFLGFSFCQFTSSNISSIKPISDLAVILNYSASFCKFILLFIFASSLFTVIRENYIKDANEFVCELDKITPTLEARSIAVYHLAMNDLARIIYKDNSGIVSLFRKIQGLPEIEDTVLSSTTETSEPIDITVEEKQ